MAFCFAVTAVPQREENKALTDFLQKGGVKIWIGAIAGFSGQNSFPE